MRPKNLIEFSLDIFVTMLTLIGFDRHSNTISILRKTIEGYLESVPSLTFNTIKTKLIVHAFHSSKYLKIKMDALL